jgi:hypothetical protein
VTGGGKLTRSTVRDTQHISTYHDNCENEAVVADAIRVRLKKQASDCRQTREGVSRALSYNAAALLRYSHKNKKMLTCDSTASWLFAASRYGLT